ncbi:MAG: hypothetical protein JSU94_15760 [Phycisphaerales bacterium]|nr:MAG: hypothetical protein JSU94_15760 [Phycisphaerales bacterium]
MASVPGRNKRLESLVSIVLLVMLLIVGLGVVMRQSDVDMTRFGIGLDVSGPPAEPEEPASPAVLDLDSFAPDGFKTVSAARTYGPENLYEKINGKAPLYTDSGFVSLSTQRFVSTADENLWIELFIYDMAALRNAFSVYSLQKRLDSQALSALQYAYSTSSGVYLVCGGYYVELIGSAESPGLLGAMKPIVDRLKMTLPDEEAGRIAELEFFPPENRVAGSEKLYLANAFGFEGLENTFVCRYETGGQEVTAFLGKGADPQASLAVAKGYCDFLIENDATPAEAAGETIRAASGRVFDFYGTTEIVFAVGPFFGGIHEAEDKRTAEQLAETLIIRLTEAAKESK